MLDEILRALLRAEDAGDPHEALQEVDRVREPYLDCAPQGCVRFHKGMRNRLPLMLGAHGVVRSSGAVTLANFTAVWSRGAGGRINLNPGAERETLPFSLWPSIENTEEARG